MPLSTNDITTAYHYREIEIIKLAMYAQPLDIFISHDWPSQIYNHGDKKSLLERKKHFRKDVSNNSLGSPPLKLLLMNLMPKQWFSAHMHVRFEAVVRHNDKRCDFLALDKCLPRRAYLELITLPLD